MIHCLLLQMDQRGRHGNRPNKTSDEDIEFVRNHINSFPTQTSHYSRRHNPNLKYLSSDLNIAIMYRLYREKCLSENITAVNMFVYRSNFHKYFSLSFKKPKSDTCKSCDSLNIKILAEVDPVKKQSLTNELTLHKKKAKSAYDNLQSDTQVAKKDNDIHVITIDLQQCLPTPHLTVGVTFYKRQLWTFNFGVHNVASDDAYMYMWSEDVAGRGADDIISCINQYIQHNVLNNVKHLIVYSDSCFAQNKNINLISYWSYLVQSGIFETIEQKFLASGHTYLPCDRDFGLIEKKKRGVSHIFVPDEWIDLVKKARVKKPFKVTKMSSDMFVSTEPLLAKTTKRTVSTNNKKVLVSKVACLMVKKDESFKYFFKYTYNDIEEYDSVDIKKKTAGRLSLKDIELPKKYTTKRQIKPAKLKDVFELLDYVPPVYHQFYRSLTQDSENITNETIIDEEFDYD